MGFNFLQLTVHESRPESLVFADVGERGAHLVELVLLDAA